MELKQLTHTVIGLAMKVHRHFGPGYLEEVYKNALIVELEHAGIRALKEVPIQIDYEGVRVGNYVADIIVENCLILELKATTTLVMRHEMQLVNYLAATQIEDGLLINFGSESLQFKHKYRNYHKPINPVNSACTRKENHVNPVNPVQERGEKTGLTGFTRLRSDADGTEKLRQRRKENHVNPVNPV